MLCRKKRRRKKNRTELEFFDKLDSCLFVEARAASSFALAVISVQPWMLVESRYFRNAEQARGCNRERRGERKASVPWALSPRTRAEKEKQNRKMPCTNVPLSCLSSLRFLSYLDSWGHQNSSIAQHLANWEDCDYHWAETASRRTRQPWRRAISSKRGGALYFFRPFSTSTSKPPDYKKKKKKNRKSSRRSTGTRPLASPSH